MKRRLPFTKMHGAGNDFIMVNASDLGSAVVDRARIAAWCDRRTGIGADGLIVIGPGGSAGTSFRMTYYNADGGEAEMCGNGARCSVAFAHELGLVAAGGSFDTGAGVLDGAWHGPEDVEVTLTPWTDLRLDLDIGGTPWPAVHSCNTGVPHLVIPVDDIEDVPLDEWGARLRHHEAFAPRGTNVNWVARPADDAPFLMRTYERGVEGETLACGTGASAVAVVMSRLGRAGDRVPVRTRNGDLLVVTVDHPKKSLVLRGPAITSFTGEVAT
jgi:diaminopimelate epimerase